MLEIHCSSEVAGEIEDMPEAGNLSWLAGDVSYAEVSTLRALACVEFRQLLP